MCAVIGAVISKACEEDIDLLKNLYCHSQIRGKHATGIAYVKNNKLYCESHPIPAMEFVERFNFEKILNSDGSVKLIGHCRYSTSDLSYNQPIRVGTMAVVHNGVITQEPPELWQKKYYCQTKNDSELILRSDYSKEFPEWSGALLVLDTDIHPVRNGKRPLYCAQKNNNTYYFSTKDIGKRSGISDCQLIPNSEELEWQV